VDHRHPSSICRPTSRVSWCNSIAPIGRRTAPRGRVLAILRDRRRQCLRLGVRSSDPARPGRAIHHRFGLRAGAGPGGRGLEAPRGLHRQRSEFRGARFTQAAKRRARGYRTTRNLKAIVYRAAGKLDFTPAT
jgi:hypothetical protein